MLRCAALRWLCHNPQTAAAVPVRPRHGAPQVALRWSPDDHVIMCDALGMAWDEPNLAPVVDFSSPAVLRSYLEDHLSTTQRVAQAPGDVAAVQVRAYVRACARGAVLRAVSCALAMY